MICYTALHFTSYLREDSKCRWGRHAPGTALRTTPGRAQSVSDEDAVEELSASCLATSCVRVAYAGSDPFQRCATLQGVWVYWCLPHEGVSCSGMPSTFMEAGSVGCISIQFVSCRTISQRSMSYLRDTPLQRGHTGP